MDNDTSYKKFIVGKEYRVMNYETDKCSNISVLEHKGTWVRINIEDRVREVRVYRVNYPPSESILLNGYSPIYSYNALDNPERDDIL